MLAGKLCLENGDKGRPCNWNRGPNHNPDPVWPGPGMRRRPPSTGSFVGCCCASLSARPQTPAVAAALPPPELLWALRVPPAPLHLRLWRSVPSPVPRLLHIRVYPVLPPSGVPTCPPASPQHRLVKCLPCPESCRPLRTDESTFLPLPAAAEHRWRPELRFYCFQQVEE